MERLLSFSTFKKLTKAITEITNSTRGLDGKATFLPQKIAPKKLIIVAAMAAKPLHRLYGRSW